MFLEKPRVEFVKINFEEAFVTNSSPGTGGGQYCKASQVDAAYCPGWAGDVDWSQE